MKTTRFTAMVALIAAGGPPLHLAQAQVPGEGIVYAIEGLSGRRFA